MSGSESVELQKFVSDSILAILKGVADAAVSAGEDRDGIGGVNPSFGRSGDGLQSLVREIKFDVAVTASAVKTGNVGAEIKVYVASIDGTGTIKSESSTVNRLSFSVPVIMKTNPVV